MNIGPLIEKLKILSKKKIPLVVAIDGRSGSGKSTLAQKIKEVFPDTEIIHLDAYEMYAGEKSVQRVTDEVLKPINMGQFKNEIIIVEGIFAFSTSLLPFYDYLIWVECSEKIGFQRGLKRDRKKDGVDYSDKWLEYWLPKERDYIEKENPQKMANYVVENVS